VVRDGSRTPFAPSASDALFGAEVGIKTILDDKLNRIARPLVPFESSVFLVSNFLRKLSCIFETEPCYVAQAGF
jgi:hypothetical protein